MSISMVCVYCGSYSTPDPYFLDSAYQLGQMLGKNNFGLVYGGGIHGMMGRVADGLINCHGKSIGFIPELLLEKEGGHPGLSELHVVDSMHTRKLRMAETADAFVVMPGGFGTLDELFEIITWRQIQIHNKPIIIVNLHGYWDHLEKLFNNVIDGLFAKKEHRDIVRFTSSIEEAIDYLKNCPMSDRAFKSASV